MKQFKMKKKEEKWGYFSILGTLGLSLLRNILASKEKSRAGEGFIKAS